MGTVAETNYWALFAILFPVGLLLFTGGVLLYRRKFVGLIVLDSFLTGKPSLACTYLGVWLMLMSVGHFVLETEVDALIVPYGLLALGCLAIGVIGWLWMPRFLQPRWMKKGTGWRPTGKTCSAGRS